jgi:hypothetical protein
MASGSSGLQPMTKLFIGIDVAVVVVLAAAEVVLVLGCKKKTKETQLEA